MQTLFTPFFAVASLIFASCSSADVTKNFQRDQIQGIIFANFEIRNSHRLFSPSAMRTSTTKQVSSTRCAHTCLLIPWCFSYNFKKTPDNDNKHVCEALSIDIYNNSKDFQPNVEFDHFSIVSQCANHPCQNGGHCVALYEKDDYICDCPDDFQGRHCEAAVIVPTACKDLHGEEEDKAYPLLMDSGEAVHVYCHMTDIPGCSDGGWTLVMKIDGSKSTFGFESSYWSDNNTYNVTGGMTGFDHEETKLPTYWNTPFTKICLGMKVGSDTRFILLPKQAPSLYSLIADGNYRATSLTRNTWTSLIGGSSLQQNCKKQGFNTVPVSADHSKARIGYIGNQENDCITTDSVIGFGIEDIRFDKTCGNVAASNVEADNGVKDTPAMGFIFVQ